eukprot:SAG11_NODE_1040_length_6065_cov_2.701307_2_plen_93_part_00
MLLIDQSSQASKPTLAPCIGTCITHRCKLKDVEGKWQDGGEEVFLHDSRKTHSCGADFKALVEFGARCDGRGGGGIIFVGGACARYSCCATA